MKIFKYLTPERIDILQNKRIRFTQAAYLNDPFETLPFLNQLMSESESDKLYKLNVHPIIANLKNELASNKYEIAPELKKIFTKYSDSEIINLLKEGLPMIDNLTKNINGLLLSSPAESFGLRYSEKLKESWSKIFGVLCLTQTNDNIQMWSHYSSNHMGFIIEFNDKDTFFDKKLTTQQRFMELRKVKYVKQRPQINLYNSSISESEITEYLVQNILFTKNLGWKSEKEVRMIFNLRSYDKKIIRKGEYIYLFNFHPSVIKSVYLGNNSSEELSHKIKNILQYDDYSHVKLYKAELDLKDYKINFNEQTNK